MSSKTITLPTVDRPKPAPRPAPVPVIVETFADGFLQVFAAPHVRVVVVNHLADDGSPALHNTIDEYHELELPRSHRPLYDPRRIVAMGDAKPRTIQGEANRRAALAMLRAFRQATEVLSEGRATP